MKNLILTSISALALTVAAVGCKSGGATDGAKDGPASAPASQAAAAAGHAHKPAGAAVADATVPVVFDSAPAVGTKARCPVSGDVFTVAEDTQRAEHDGKHVAFCCDGCVDKFKADPAKFLDKAEAAKSTMGAAAGAATEAKADAAVPVAFDAPPAVGTKARCPVSGDVFTVEADTERAEHDGKHVVFCCDGCVDKFKADPAKFLTAK